MELTKTVVKDKECSKCHRVLPLEEFYTRRASKDGKCVWCKSCAKKLMGEWHLKNREKHMKQMREYYYAHRSEMMERTKRWYANNREKAKEYYRTHKSKIMAYMRKYYHDHKKDAKVLKLA